MNPRLPFPLLFVGAIAIAPTAADAQQAVAEQPATGADRVRLRYFELSLRAGFRTRLYSDIDASGPRLLGNEGTLTLELASPWMSQRVLTIFDFVVGLGVPPTGQSATCNREGISCSQRSWGGGFGLRWALPLFEDGPLAPWIAGMVTWRATWLDVATVPGLCAGGCSFQMGAFGLDFAVGADHTLSKHFAMGPYVQLSTGDSYATSGSFPRQVSGEYLATTLGIRGALME